MNICVYCSSSHLVDQAYVAAARQLGMLLGKGGHGLVWGGADVGLMGELARAAQQSGARLYGVIPRLIHEQGLSFDGADRMLITETMAERKTAMEAESQAFVALPGGFGTLEELLQVMTLKQLGYLDAPVVLMNTPAPAAPDGFYQPLVTLFESFYEQQFAKPAYRQLYHIAQTPDEAMNYIEQYRSESLPTKWTTLRS